MGLVYASDSRVADWIVESATPIDRLITLGPDGFERYARLRFIPDPTAPGQMESDALIDEGHQSDLEQTRRAVSVLSRFTRTPAGCYFCVWDGTGMVLPTATDARFVDLPHRRYALFQGEFGELERWSQMFGADATTPPAFIWPEDRAWCFTCDVDPHWAGIGASGEAIAALTADDTLDVVPALPGEEPPAYR